MSLVVRKPIFGVSSKVRHKLGCTTTGRWLEDKNVRFRKYSYCTIYVSKVKALISCAVTFLIGSSSYLQVMRTTIISLTSKN